MSAVCDLHSLAGPSVLWAGLYLCSHGVFFFHSVFHMLFINQLTQNSVRKALCLRKIYFFYYELLFILGSSSVNHTPRFVFLCLKMESTIASKFKTSYKLQLDVM